MGVSGVVENLYGTVVLVAEFGPVGGTRTYVEQLISFYGKRARSVVVIGTNGADQLLDRYANHFGASYIPIEDICGDPNVLGKLYFPFRLRDETRLLQDFVTSRNPDLVVASVGTPGRFLGLMGFRKPSLYILHTYPMANKKKVLAIAIRLVVPFLVPKGASFITVSEFSKNQMIDVWGLGFLKKKISVIHNTAGPEVEKIRQLRSCSVVLTVGHVVQYKNPMAWVAMATEVIAKLPGTQFFWVGPGPMLEECRQQVVDEDLTDSIFFVGEVSDVSPYYEKASVYCQPSLVESLSLSVLDAMRHGIPSVVSAVGGLPEVVDDNTTGFVVSSYDETSFSGRVIELLESPLLRGSMGARAREVYTEQFSLEHWEGSLEQFHKRLGSSEVESRKKRKFGVE